MNKRLQSMIDNQLIPNRGGCFIDAYNQSINEEIAGTITTRVDASNMSFVTEPTAEIKYVGQMSSSQNSRVIDPDGISYAMTNGEKDATPKIIEPIGCAMRGRNPEKPSERGRSNGKYKQRIEMGRNISNTITSVQKDSLVAEPLRIPQATKQSYIEVPPGSLFDMSYPESKTRIGRVQEGGKVSPTLMAGGEPPCYYEGVEFKDHHLHEGDGLYLGDSKDFFRGGLAGMSRALKAAQTDTGVVQNYRIRKLTPRECFRLMGVSESDIDKIQQAGISHSRQYQLAGNSIVTDVLVQIFRKMFVETEQESQQLSLF